MTYNPFTEDNKPLQPGIYFGLDKRIYFNDPSISRTDILNLIEDPMQYWLTSWMCPYRRIWRKESPAMAEGTAFHCLLLEPEKFKVHYTIQPGEPWAAGKIMIHRPDYERMQAALRIIQLDPDISRMFLHGYPEVVLVWIDPDTKITLRVMLDWMKTFGVVDYKTTEHGLSDKSIGRDMTNRGYDIQEALYLEGFTQVRRMFKARNGLAKVRGAHDPAFVKEFLRSPEDEDKFGFVFQQRNYPHAVKIYDVDYEVRHTATGIIRAALDIYTRCMAEFGPDKMWMPEDKYYTLTKEHVRRY